MDLDQGTGGLQRGGLDPPALLGPFGRTRSEIERVAREEEKLGPLNDNHWRVIQFVRAYYRDQGRPPALVRVGRATGYGVRRLGELFPCGVVKTVFRLAGLDLPLDLTMPCPWAVLAHGWNSGN